MSTMITVFKVMVKTMKKQLLSRNGASASRERVCQNLLLASNTACPKSSRRLLLWVLTIYTPVGIITMTLTSRQETTFDHTYTTLIKIKSRLLYYVYIKTFAQREIGNIVSISIIVFIIKCHDH